MWLTCPSKKNPPPTPRRAAVPAVDALTARFIVLGDVGRYCSIAVSLPIRTAVPIVAGKRKLRLLHVEVKGLRPKRDLILQHELRQPSKAQIASVRCAPLKISGATVDPADRSDVRAVQPRRVRPRYFVHFVPASRNIAMRLRPPRLLALDAECIAARSSHEQEACERKAAMRRGSLQPHALAQSMVTRQFEVSEAFRVGALIIADSRPLGSSLCPA